jgi:type IV secretory pathway ATPase VirB11/archaellum biosynthesis ATPase
VNRIVNESNPIADARLEDGSRVNIVLPPVAIDGAVLTIRKFPRKVINIEDLIQKESLTFEAATFLDLLVKGTMSVIFSSLVSFIILMLNNEFKYGVVSIWKMFKDALRNKKTNN